VSIGTLSNYEVALDKLQGEIDRGPITESEVEMSSRLGIPPRAMTDEDWHALSQPQTGQSVEPDYGPQGLKQVSPAAEIFGLGLGKIAVNAASKTKMYSDQVVDRISRFKTPNTTYHGGPSGLSKLETSFDRAIAETGSGGPLQAGIYTASRNRGLAENYATHPIRGGSVYDVDISDVNKIFDINNPSKYMQAEIKKEIKRLKLESAGGPTPHLKIKRMEELLTGAGEGRHITGQQREFLEKYGYEGMRTKAGYNFINKKQKDEIIIGFRPEKYKIEEVPIVPKTRK